MSARRTSCPRLPDWEEPNDRGLIKTEELNGRLVVRITPAGLEFPERKKLDAAPIASDHVNRARKCEYSILRELYNGLSFTTMALPNGERPFGIRR